MTNAFDTTRGESGRYTERDRPSDHNHTLPIMCETVRCRHDVGHAFSHCFRPRDKFKSFGREENQPRRVVTWRRDGTSSVSKAIERLERCHVNLYHAYFVTSCETHSQRYSVNYHKICRLRSIGVIIYLKCVLLSPESYRRSEFFSRAHSATNFT